MGEAGIGCKIQEVREKLIRYHDKEHDKGYP
jgi:hypothetical protein